MEDRHPYTPAAIGGSPTPEEERAVMAAIEELLREERNSKRRSAWKLAGRSEAVGSGVLDTRDWNAASWLPWTGRRYAGRHGRGDAK